MESADINTLSKSDSEESEEVLASKRRTRNSSKRSAKYNKDKFSTSSIDDIVSDSEVAIRIKAIARRQAKAIYREVIKLRSDSFSSDDSSMEEDNNSTNTEDISSERQQTEPNTHSFQFKNQKHNTKKSRRQGN